MDLPTYIEANVICSFLLKLSWVCCYIIVYGLRPVLIRPKKVGGSPPQGCLSCRPPRCSGEGCVAVDLLV